MVISSMVGSVQGTSTNAINLLTYAMSFDSFKGSEYVIFNDSDYSYYIVWGDLKHENGQVKSNGAVEYIHYYRTSTSGYNSVYSYQVGGDSSFVLDLSSEYITTSNIEEVGFRSQVGEQYEFYNSASMLLVFAVAMIFAIMVKVFRRMVNDIN